MCINVHKLICRQRNILKIYAKIVCQEFAFWLFQFFGSQVFVALLQSIVVQRTSSHEVALFELFQTNRLHVHFSENLVKFLGSEKRKSILEALKTLSIGEKQMLVALANRLNDLAEIGSRRLGLPTVSYSFATKATHNQANRQRIRKRFISDSLW